MSPLPVTAMLGHGQLIPWMADRQMATFSMACTTVNADRQDWSIYLRLLVRSKQTDERQQTESDANEPTGTVQGAQVAKRVSCQGHSLYSCHL